MRHESYGRRTTDISVYVASQSQIYDVQQDNAV
jgi:hypothetical protein